MSKSKKFAVIGVLICIFAVTTTAFVGFMATDSGKSVNNSENRYIVSGKEITEKEYLTGCILYSMAGLDEPPAEASSKGINAVAAALLSNLRYLHGREATGLFSVTYWDEEKSADWYAGEYEQYRKTAEAAADYALKTTITYNGKGVFLPVCRISSVTLMTDDNMAYLKKIYCPIDEKAQRFSGGCQFTCDGIAEKLLAKYPQLVLAPDRESWIEEIKTDNGGNVTSIKCGGITMSGYEFRRIFGIRSVNFDVSYQQGVYSFATKGDGDSMGISVYAAVKLAEKGYSEKEILDSFFEGLNFSAADILA